MNKQETYKPNNIAWQEWSNPCNTICCSHASVSKRTLYLIILICGHVEPSPGPFWIWPPSCPWPCKWYWARGYRPLGSSSGERDCRPWSWGRGPGDEVLGTRSWGRGPGDETRLSAYLITVGNNSLDQTQTAVKERLMKNFATIDIITVIIQNPFKIRINKTKKKKHNK